MDETEEGLETFEPVRSFDRTGWEEVIFELADVEPEPDTAEK